MTYLLAQAAADSAATTDGPANPWVSLLSLLPLLLVFALVYVFLIRAGRRSKGYMDEALGVARASDAKLARIVELLERQAATTTRPGADDEPLFAEEVTDAGERR